MTIFYTSEKLNVRILTSKTLIERHLFLFYQSECIFFGENSEKEIQGLKFKKKYLISVENIFKTKPFT